MKQNIPNTMKNGPSAFVLPNSGPLNVAETLIEKENQTQPFYIFNIDEAYKRIQHFKQIMPRVKIFYAITRNNDPMMLKLAVSQNLGFSCASPAEILKLRQLHVSPRNIIYTAHIKPLEHITYAKASGITHTIFDSRNELKKLKQYWEDARFEKEWVFPYQVIGVTFDGDQTAKSYVNGLNFAKKLFEHEKQAGRQMKIVNIGGGFPSETVENINEIARIINDKTEALFSEDVQIIAEAGKYFCMSAFTLYCTISNVLPRVHKNGNIVNVMYIMDGVFGTLKHCKDPQKIKKLQLGNKTAEHNNLEETILWGPSCHYLDRVASNNKVLLPRCTPQDWLVFTDHGSDTITYNTHFSSILIPSIQRVISSDLCAKLSASKVFTDNEFVFQLVTPLSNTLPIFSPHSEAKIRGNVLTI